MEFEFAALQSAKVLSAWAGVDDGLNPETPQVPSTHLRGRTSSSCSSLADFELVLGGSSSASSSCSLLLSDDLRRSCSDSDRSSCSASDVAPISSRQSLSGASSYSGLCYQRDSHTCTTCDGWQLHITHVYNECSSSRSSGSSDSGSGSGACSRQQQGDGSRCCPVLLVPGLASSGEHTFDLMPGCSLVESLVEAGWDVWVADLRGNGRSQKPRLFDRSTWWAVDDHLLKDAPAVLDYVLSHTGASQLHWIGHSMGGMLAVGLLSQQHKLAGALRSVTMLASGCFGAGSWHAMLKPLINRITKYGFPAGIVLGALSLLTGTAAALWPIEALFFMPGNMRAPAARKLLAGCFNFIPVGVIEQFMGSLNSPAGLSSSDGSFCYADPAVLAQVQVPVLGINGTCDLFCPAAGGKKTVELFGSSNKQFMSIGSWWRPYGHFDVVAGKQARMLVHPQISDFLSRHDGQPVLGGSFAASTAQL